MEPRGQDIIVTRRTDGDSFRVREDCTCWYARTEREDRCWQQVYTGLPCNHAVIATLERLRLASRNDDSRDSICKAFVDSVHPNWLRRTYLGSKEYDIYQPAPIIRSKPTARNRKFVTRFRQVLPFVGVREVQEILYRLESMALQPQGIRSGDLHSGDDFSKSSDSATESNVSDDALTGDEVPHRPDLHALLNPNDNNGAVRFANPRKRKKNHHRR